MKKYRSREHPSVIASYVSDKIQHHYNKSVGEQSEGRKAILSYRDGEAVIEEEFDDSRIGGPHKIKVSGNGKILGWTKNMLSKPHSPVSKVKG